MVKAMPLRSQSPLAFNQILTLLMHISKLVHGVCLIAGECVITSNLYALLDGDVVLFVVFPIFPDKLFWLVNSLFV